MRPALAAQVRFDAEVGAAGNQRRVGITRRGSQTTRRRLDGRENPPARDRVERRSGPAEPILQRSRGSGAERQRRIANRTVAGAAAQIAGHRQRIARAGSIRPVLLGEQAHDEPGRAVAALRTAGRGNRLLRRRQRAVRREPFDGDRPHDRRPVPRAAGSCSRHDRRSPSRTARRTPPRMRRTRLPRTLPWRRSALERAGNRAGSSLPRRRRRRTRALRSPRTRSSRQPCPSWAQPVSRSLSAIWPVGANGEPLTPPKTPRGRRAEPAAGRRRPRAGTRRS